MRNVKLENHTEWMDKIAGFILTMRNVKHNAIKNAVNEDIVLY